MTQYYFWLVVFMLVVYLIATDDSIIYATKLGFKILKFQYEKVKWWTLNNPRNPIIKYFIWRRSLRIAKELEKEFKN